MIRRPPRSTLFPYTTLFRSEARVPFLDHALVEFTMRLPTDLKIRGGRTKYLLKKAMTGLLPEEIDRKSTRLNSSHLVISYAVFCLKKKKKTSLHASPDFTWL